MGVYNLDKIFRPSSIAVIGASEREGSIGSALMQISPMAGSRGLYSL